jgi:acyl-CoA thioester hydrolase
MRPGPPGDDCGRGALFPVRVYYEDTDLSGVVYHANYLRWFERPLRPLRMLGVDQRAARGGRGRLCRGRHGHPLPHPAKLDDAVVFGPSSRIWALLPANVSVSVQKR